MSADSRIWPIVAINGVDYVPRETKIPDHVLAALSELYGVIWVEACYDPKNAATKEFAVRLLPLMKKVNETLRFKR